jgi:uncharacterized protein
MRIPLEDVFAELRRLGLPLGVEDLLAAQRALARGFGADRVQLVRMCQTLWARSAHHVLLVREVVESRLPAELPPLVFLLSSPETEEQRATTGSMEKAAGSQLSERQESISIAPELPAAPNGDFEEKTLADLFGKEEPPEEDKDEREEDKDEREAKEEEDNSPRFPATTVPPFVEEQAAATWKGRDKTEWKGDAIARPGLPFLRPSVVQASSCFDLAGSLPLGRRYMEQAWRTLRRVAHSSVTAELGISETIEKLYRDGALLEPVFLRERRNQTRLLILQDVGGSMVPFERMCQAVIETAISGGLKHLQTAYFHDIPEEIVFREPWLARPLALERLLAAFTKGSVLIISDAGAARGGLDGDRIRRTKEAVERILRYTAKLAWLNPTPESRWPTTTANAVRRQVPLTMASLSHEGLQQILDALRSGPRV